MPIPKSKTSSLQPYWQTTDRQLSLAYLAGIVDGEAYIGIKKSKPSPKHGRKTPGYRARIQVRMVDEPAIKFLAEFLGGNYYKEKPHSSKGRPLFCFQASDRKAEYILKQLAPYLRVKRCQAETVLNFLEFKSTGMSHRTKIVGYRNFTHHTGKKFKVRNLAYSDEFVDVCEKMYLRCKSLNIVGV